MAGNEGKAAPSQLAIRHRRKPNRKNKTKTRKPSRALRPKARRRARRNDNIGRVTTFPEVKGKVVREVRFSHYDPENVLAIAFKDRTVLVFEVDPTPLVLPADIRAHYIGERRSAAKTWERLAAD
jgi:hypothetical protein